MHIKRDISIRNLKTILNFLLRIPGFSGRSKRVLTICLLSAKLPAAVTSPGQYSNHCHHK